MLVCRKIAVLFGSAPVKHSHSQPWSQHLLLPILACVSSLPLANNETSKILLKHLLSYLFAHM